MIDTSQLMLSRRCFEAPLVDLDGWMGGVVEWGGWGF